MTTDEALKNVQDHVQWCREEGETDLRGILFHIKELRKELQQSASATSTPAESVNEVKP